MIRHIPNFVTLLNLFCGSIAVIFAVNGSLVIASFFAFLGIFFDFFDGLLARKLNAQSDLGLQLDSLADMVTSGLVPGIVMFQLFNLQGTDWFSFGVNEAVGFNGSLEEQTYLPLMGLLITLASAYRLAKFNIDDNQTDSFIGLPTPANTLLILSFPLIMEFQNNDIMNSIIINKWFLIAITLVSCYLLNANIKLLALKFKTWNFQDNAARYLLIVLAAVLLIVFQFAAIPLIILAYIIISVLNKK
ncbi:CDP-alcohol phosphatidyltransferase family protein [Flavobacteriaceae bacterium S0825]|uniref:CDP-alcohol phosphatidyltransferase family protein n=1 Tax=Gaetbulibacter sp. S0825 TaxID=2720084 RepID=UPI00142FE6BF|nr:CDP-alcohol phosphatidyltransferase family protein [Gaetbulibacter sp. S0825]MCK0109047.1 CDP-alcohol phosphatidyltransferase family protein [Flavobacteriaceae bacterium S0825]NIX64682.1 phosphatidylserine synthase [Gaetbulibacter sp. S0825]